MDWPDQSPLLILAVSTKDCRLCGGPTESFTVTKRAVLYHHCSICGYIGLDESRRLSEEEEQSRYRLHQNDPTDPGYSRWIDSFLDFIWPYKDKQTLKILDFGSGPYPALGEALTEIGHQVSMEDPFFAPGRREGLFDLITALEVVEHLWEPNAVFKDLFDRLNPGGQLVVSTTFPPKNPREFQSWSYRADPTHVGFFPLRSFYWIATALGCCLEDHDGTRYVRLRKPSLAHHRPPC